MPPIIEPGFFTNDPVRVALLVGAIAAAVSAFVGTFTVIRGQSFAGHSLADIGAAGGSGAILVGVPSLYGFVVMNVAAAGVMELIGVRRPRGRDLATGIVLGFALGLTALFLYLTTTQTTTTGATVTVLFGSLFSVAPSTIPLVSAIGAVVVVMMVALFRPLLLTSVSYDLAAARGVPTRIVGVGYLIALALAVSLTAVTIGAILSTALLIGPPATALRLTKRVGLAIGAAAAIGVIATWLGILLAYDSAAWSPSSNGWPVSFCIVAVVSLLYLSTSLLSRLTSRRRERARSLAPGTTR